MNSASNEGNNLKLFWVATKCVALSKLYQGFEIESGEEEIDRANKQTLFSTWTRKQVRERDIEREK